MNRTTLPIAYLSFVALGLSDGMLGVAWPSMRDGFAVSLDSVGVLLTSATVGYFVLSASSGRLVRAVGVGPLLVASTALRVAGLFTLALTPIWPGAIAAFVLYGLGGGGLDAGLNTFVATRYRARQMNWLHASYGIGTTVGPLLVTALLVAGQSWRWSYSLAGALQVGLAATYMLTLRQWQHQRPGAAHDEPDTRPVPVRETLRLPLAWMSIAMLFLVSGTEVSIGQWAFPLLTESRAVPVGPAGTWVGIYWAAFTVGRIVMGWIDREFSPVRVLRWAILAGIVGAAALAWIPLGVVSFAALTLLGLAYAPLFPYLILATPSRVGDRHAPNTIGLQVSGASIGVAALTGLAGVLAERLGLEIVGPYLVVAIALMFALHEVMNALARAAQPGS